MVQTTILRFGDASSIEMMKTRTPSEKRDTIDKTMTLFRFETPYLNGTRLKMQETAKMTVQALSTSPRNRPRRGHPSKANTLDRVTTPRENRSSSQVLCFLAPLRLAGLDLRLESSI
jgi:hypothetical protein